MALKIMDLFKSIKWAKNGDVTDMSQTNYEAGWSHLGDDTPTVEDFNIVQQLNDEKDQWLFNQIKAVCDAKGITVTESDVQALLKAINTSATLSRAGITQLSSAIDSTIENMAATPKAIKTLKDLIDAITRNLNNYIPNSKKSNSVTSNSADTVATSVAAKTAYDKGVEALQKAASIRTKLIPVKGGSREVTIDATKKSDWFREMEVDGLGYYIQAFHNSGAQHNYSNFPISGRHHFIAELCNNLGYSYLRIIYPQAKRVFETSVNFNVGDLTLDWREIVFVKDGKYQGTFEVSSALISGYRMRVVRSDERSQPYLQTVDMAYDLAAPPTNNKAIGSTDYCVKDGAEERSKATTMITAYPDKQVSWELAMWNANQARQVAIKSFSKTNNTVIGKSADNDRDRLQVNGTVQATAPADNADNDQLVTSGWVRRFAQPLYETAFKIDATNQNQNLNNLLGQNKVWGVAGREANVTKLGDIYGYGVGITLNASGANAMLYIPHSRAEHNNGVWVQSSFNGNSAAPVWRRIDGADWGDIRNNPLSQSRGILHYAGNYLSVRANNGDYAGFEVVRRGNQGDFAVRYEPMPDKRIKWWVQGSHEIYMPAKTGTVAFIEDISYQKIGNFEIRKYPDGTMIQTYRFTPPQNGRMGSQMKTDNRFTWALAFVEKPKIFSQIVNPNTNEDFGSTDMTVSINHHKSTRETVVFACYEIHYNNNMMDVDFMAIGRWK